MEVVPSTRETEGALFPLLEVQVNVVLVVGILLSLFFHLVV